MLNFLIRPILSLVIFLIFFLFFRRYLSKNKGWILPLALLLFFVIWGLIWGLLSDVGTIFGITFFVAPLAFTSFVWLFIEIAIVLGKKSIIISGSLSILFFLLAIGLALLNDPGNFNIPKLILWILLSMSGFSLLWLIVQIIIKIYRHFKDKKLSNQII